MEPRDIIAGLLLALDWVADDLKDEHIDDHESHIKYLFEEKWAEEIYPEKDVKHWGDCVNVPMSCPRCLVDKYYHLADRLLETQTLPDDWDET